MHNVRESVSCLDSVDDRVSVLIGLRFDHTLLNHTTNGYSNDPVQTRNSLSVINNSFSLTFFPGH